MSHESDNPVSISKGQFYKLVLEHFPEHIFWKDRESVYLGCNQHFAKAIGLDSPQQVIGKTDLDFPFIYKEANDYRRIDKEVMNSGVPRLNFEEPQTLPSGERQWLRTSKIPLRNKRDRVIGILCTFEYITEQKILELKAIEDSRSLKKLNASLQIANQKLEERNQELEEFAYIATHHLKEPLNCILTSTDLLATDDGTEKEKHKLTKIISFSARRMKNLVEEAMNHLIIGREVQFTTLDANAIIDDILKDFSGLIHSSKVTVEVGQLPSLKASEIEFRLLFHNLISNAIKFRKADCQPHIRIDCEERNASYLFRVRDNGIGIDSASFNKVFRIFQRLHSKSAYSGMGIGLANCKKIAELHQGSIKVESEEGKGCLFIVEIGKLP